MIPAEASEQSRLTRVVVVLFEPQDPINIAAVVRAMANMGVRSLRLVRPVAYDPNLIEVVAHDTRSTVERIQHFDTLEAAVADCTYVVGFSARPRAARRTVLTAREAASELLGRAIEGTVAVMFGREDHGLPNAALDMAHALATIPTSTHASLNLAQAVMVALYELHVTAGDATTGRPSLRQEMPAPTAEDYERFFVDAERALEAINFLKTRFPEHVLRTMRSLTYRAAPDVRELSLVRAMAIEVLRTLSRAGIIRPDE